MPLDYSDPDRLTRRRFIGLIASFSVVSSLLPFNSLSSLFASEKGDSLNSKRVLEGNFKFFNPNQAQVIEEVTSLIIPSDDSPGAKEAGVVFEIDKTIAENQRLKNSYTKGIESWNQMAKQLGGKDSFLDLNQDEKMEILNMAYASKSLARRGGVSDPYGAMLPGILLINHLIRQTIAIFYTSEVGWRLVGYQGPPQWKGNPDYDKCDF
jgi:Gluconate 2-dehydrogenase subunit 3